MTNETNKANSNGDVQIREAFSYEPNRKPQGYFVNQMKEYATTEITNDDAATMKGATFRAFDFVCKNITRTQVIRRDRVYPGLRMLGYNWCYNRMKSNFGEDVFTQISSLVEEVESQLNYNNMLRSEVARGFIDVTMTKKNFRVTSQAQKLSLDKADSAGLRTSELNLYYAMHGLKVLIDNEPDFILLRENEIIVDVMRVLERAESGLMGYKNELERLR
jgi:hypothetical protein